MSVSLINGHVDPDYIGEDLQVIARRWQRYGIIPGEEVDAFIKEVNEYFDALGYNKPDVRSVESIIVDHLLGSGIVLIIWSDREIGFDKAVFHWED